MRNIFFRKNFHHCIKLFQNISTHQPGNSKFNLISILVALNQRRNVRHLPWVSDHQHNPQADLRWASIHVIWEWPLTVCPGIHQRVQLQLPWRQQRKSGEGVMWHGSCEWTPASSVPSRRPRQFDLHRWESLLFWKMKYNVMWLIQNKSPAYNAVCNLTTWLTSGSKIFGQHGLELYRIF